MPLRRSGRRSGARKSYADDPFDALGLEDEEDEKAAEKSISEKGKGQKRNREEDSDEEFDEAAAEQSFKEEEDDDDDEEVGADEEERDGADDLVEGSDGNVSESAEPVIGTSSKRSIAARNRQVNFARQRRTDGSIRYNPEDTHTRGIFNPSNHVGKSMHIKLSFGVDNRDLLAAASARTQWSLGVDATFPTRASLENVQSAAHFGPGSTHGTLHEEIEREATEAWDWYHDEVKGREFRGRQRVEKIDAERAQQKFLYKPRKSSHKVIYGPGENLSTTHLRQHESLNFGDAWKYRDETHKSGKLDTTEKKFNKGRQKKRATASEAPTSSEMVENKPSKLPQSQRRKNRYGWILNLSGKIQALSWAPNQDGLTQYLAVSVPISPEQENQYDPPEPPATSRAFSPSPSYPGALQIWSFDAEDRKDGMVKTIDTSRKPVLRLVLCMEFGHIRKVNWCPMPRRRRDEQDDSKKDLGLLACVFSDGRMRVFDIKVNRDAETTEYRKFAIAAQRVTD